MRKMERLRRSYNNAIAGPGGIRAREKMIEAVRQAAINDLFASNPERMSGGLPYPGRPKRDFSRMPDPAAAKKAAASQSRWTSLGRWAAAYGLSLAGDQIAQLVGEDTTAGRIVGSMSRVGGMAAAGGATGMAAGPLGAAAGFAGGALLGAVKEIVSALNENTEAEKQMAALYAKEGYGKRVAGYRNIAASSSLMEGWRFERELESISVADLQEAEKAFTSIVNMLNTVDAAISGGKWTSAG